MLIVGFVVVLISLMIVLPLFDAFVGLATHFDLVTTGMLSALFLLLVVALFAAVLRRFDNDLKQEVY
jgi:hypothetical protein